MTFELLPEQSMCEFTLSNLNARGLLDYPFVTSRLDALDKNAYAAFQASNDLKDVVDRVMGGGGTDGGVAKPGMKKALSVRANIMTPVKPMLVSPSPLHVCACVCQSGISTGESWYTIIIGS